MTARREEVLRELERVLASDTFSRAHRLQRFLRHVVEATLDGDGDRLNQISIAIDVFDRDSAFDPTTDAIVRVEAGRLRAKLLEHYDSDDAKSPVRIYVPRRSYSAEFQSRASEPDEPTPRANPRSASQTVLAVMPFLNMSADPEQEYFADGITEDLITDLSKVGGLGVIARQSSFLYKGAQIDARQVCKELGADLMLEGSVQRSGHRVRVNAQLIDGATGQHCWADRFDREAGDLFSLQDEVNQTIVRALIQSASDERQLGTLVAVGRGTEDLDAHDYVLRGRSEAEAYDGEASLRARHCFEQAIALDPSYAAAHARLALNSVYRWIAGWEDDPGKSVAHGLSCAERAVSLDGDLAIARAALGWAQIWSDDFSAGLISARRAVGLDSNDVVARERLCLGLAWAGRGAESLDVLERAQDLNPHEPYYFEGGCAQYASKNDAEAIASFTESTAQQPNFIPAYLFLIATCSRVGDEARARAAAAQVKRVNRGYRVGDRVRATFADPIALQSFEAALRAAGL